MMEENAKVPDPTEYVATVLRLYVELPETPSRAGPHDRERADELHRRRVPLNIVESAFLLGSLRRLGRPPESPRLSPIRSLAYFMPVIEELTANPFPDGYLEYLRYKMRKLGAQNVKLPRTGVSSKKSGSS
jgi:hypothetical protein